MLFSARLPGVTVYHDALFVTSVPASMKLKPDAGVGGVEHADLAC